MDIGWVGMGRMGYPMAERVLKAKFPLKVWNRTKSKAEPLAKHGATIVDKIEDLRGCDVVITMLMAGKDLEEVCFGPGGLVGDGKKPGIIVDCSTIGMDESASVREKLKAKGIDYLAAPVSGNPKCVVAGKLSCVASGSKAAYDKVEKILEAFAARGVTYAGEGELSRICKIAHNVMLGVVITNLIEIMLLAQRAGVPRHAFLKFMNNSVMGSIFTQYKSPALANLDFTTTFPIAGTRKDVDLGLKAAREMGVAMPVTAVMREVLQAHFGMAASKPNPEAYLAQDFATLLETMAAMSGMKLVPDNVPVPSGLEV